MPPLNIERARTRLRRRSAVMLALVLALDAAAFGFTWTAPAGPPWRAWACLGAAVAVVLAWNAAIRADLRTLRGRD